MGIEAVIPGQERLEQNQESLTMLGFETPIEALPAFDSVMETVPSSYGYSTSGSITPEKLYTDSGFSPLSPSVRAYNLYCSYHQYEEHHALKISVTLTSF
ncbi:MAG: hypothetical protein EHM53_06300 [Methanoregulaceae archaeon]|nr:MAG: hypothetical protein EHM53_06300 [Methanoregulaceae archaeon]